MENNEVSPADFPQDEQQFKGLMQYAKWKPYNKTGLQIAATSLENMKTEYSAKWLDEKSNALMLQYNEDINAIDRVLRLIAAKLEKL